MKELKHMKHSLRYCAKYIMYIINDTITTISHNLGLLVKIENAVKVYDKLMHLWPVS